MTYEQIANEIVCYLNRMNSPQNDYDKYELEHWHGGIWPNYTHQAVIYHHGGNCSRSPFGMIAWTNANDKCKDYENACMKMIQSFMMKFFKIEFASKSELLINMAIVGI